MIKNDLEAKIIWLCHSGPITATKIWERLNLVGYTYRDDYIFRTLRSMAASGLLIKREINTGGKKSFYTSTTQSVGEMTLYLERRSLSKQMRISTTTTSEGIMKYLGAKPKPIE